MIFRSAAGYNPGMKLGKGAWIALFLALLVLASILYISFQPDDYFIYLQYARNLKQSGQAAFNPGEPSYGFTSPLWLGILGLGFDSAHPHFFPKLVSLLIYGLAILLFWLFCQRRFGSEIAVTGLLLLFFNPWVWRWSLSGMETTAALLCAIILVIAWVEEKHWLWFPLGILPLLRPELLAWTLAGAAWLSLKKRPFSGLLALLPPAAWLLISRLAFGQWFPNTAHAKAAGFSAAAAWKAAEKTLLTLQPVDLAALGLAVWGLVVIRRLKRPGRGLLVLTLLLAAMFAFKGVKVHTRYLVPLFPLTVTLFLYTTLRFPRWRRGIAAASLLVSLTQTVVWVYPATRDYIRSERRVNQEIGRWLRENTPPDSRIFLWDIGAIAFESGRRIIDMNGLLDARIFHRRTPYPEIIARQMQGLDPDTPHYLVDVHRQRFRARGKIPGIETEFLFSRPFHHMFVFQKRPLYYSLYRLRRRPAPRETP